MIGILVGIGVAFLLSGVFGSPQLISPLAVVRSARFSMAIGVFFGYYPARKAAISIRSMRCTSNNARTAGSGATRWPCESASPRKLRLFRRKASFLL